MRHLLLRSALGSGLLLFGLTARAQINDFYCGHQVSMDRARFLDQVGADLDRAESTASSFNGDMDRIAAAREDMSVFQRKADACNYDPRKLTETIVSIQKVLDHNAMYDRTRDNLVSDLNRLRDMRSRYDDFR